MCTFLDTIEYRTPLHLCKSGGGERGAHENVANINEHATHTDGEIA